MQRAEGERGGDSQPTAKMASWQDCLFRHINLGADSRCIVSERDSGLRQTSATRRAGHQLDAEFLFQPSEPPADNGLGNAKPMRGWRYALGRGDLNERTQVFYFQNDSPFLISRHSVSQTDP